MVPIIVQPVITKYHSGLDNKIYFLTILDPRKYKIKVLANLISGEDSSWLVDGHLIVVSSHGREREKESMSK